ncbi:MAG: transglutaminase domain-containing protein [Thermoguttaceae bacterium]
MRFLLLSVCLLAFCATGFLGAVEPTVDSIDYAHPDIYRDFPDSLGDRAAILAQASKLKGKSELQTIRNVLRWMDQNLQYDGKIAYQWRNYDDVMREKKYGGCADQGIVCGVLLKGAGIPTVWVKTMDAAWIWTFKKERPFSSWSGHVFLEVFVDGKWSLLDRGARLFTRIILPK